LSIILPKRNIEVEVDYIGIGIKLAGQNQDGFPGQSRIPGRTKQYQVFLHRVHDRVGFGWIEHRPTVTIDLSPPSSPCGP
jgi:hypothetical protein